VRRPAKDSGRSRPGGRQRSMPRSRAAEAPCFAPSAHACPPRRCSPGHSDPWWASEKQADVTGRLTYNRMSRPARNDPQAPGPQHQPVPRPSNAAASSRRKQLPLCGLSGSIVEEFPRHPIRPSCGKCRELRVSIQQHLEAEAEHWAKRPLTRRRRHSSRRPAPRGSLALEALGSAAGSWVHCCLWNSGGINGLAFVEVLHRRQAVDLPPATVCHSSFREPVSVGRQRVWGLGDPHLQRDLPAPCVARK